MFRKKRQSKMVQETVIEKPKRPEWKSCRYCTKCVPKSGCFNEYRCEDTYRLLIGIEEWDRCDGFCPKDGCVTCNKTKYCKLDHMNEIYADKKVTCAKVDKCASWVALPEITAMLKHEEDQ